MSSITQKVCKVDGCENKPHAKQLCNNHYYRYKSNGDPLVTRRNRDHEDLCTVDSCTNKYRTMGLCQTHYSRLRDCGDINATIPIRSRKNHPQTGSPEHKIWIGMKQRCYNKNAKNYKDWGGRGIKVCDRWLNSFKNFYEDMGKMPTDTRYTIERMDNDGDYEPGNCRWATYTEQLNNTRRNRYISHNGKTMNIMQWSKELNIKYNTIRSRLDKGFPTKLVLSKNYLPRKIRTRLQ